MITVKPARISRGALIGGQFRLERQLGQGGISAVWVARDIHIGRLVAVKLLGPEAMAKPQLRQRFAREARITSRVRSPHVAQVFAEGVTSGGVPFVVMELLEGESLAAHLAYVGRCSLVTAGAVIEQVCRALSSAHVAGLVHRDVKPANIFLTQQPNGELHVRLLDFGLAKELLFSSPQLRQAGELLGTADYVSPEQLCSPETVNSGADIWSLGATLYEVLTGRRPFEDNTFALLALRIAEGSFLPPSQACPDLPSDVDAVIARALTTDPARRYATAAEFSTAFLKVVRAHCSDAVVRPDVLRVLQAYEERTPHSQMHRPSHDRALLNSAYEESTKFRERMFGVLLVGLCIAVVCTSWLVASTLDDQRSETTRSAVSAHASTTFPNLQPLAADTAPPVEMPAETEEEPSLPSGFSPPPSASSAEAPAPSMSTKAARTITPTPPASVKPVKLVPRRVPPELSAGGVSNPPPSAASRTTSVDTESKYGF